jgi:hypothetical protein
VRAGDVLHPVVGHAVVGRDRIVRQWGVRPQFTLVMLSLSSLGALFFAADSCATSSPDIPATRSELHESDIRRCHERW